MIRLAGSTLETSGRREHRPGVATGVMSARTVLVAGIADSGGGGDWWVEEGELMGTNSQYKSAFSTEPPPPYHSAIRTLRSSQHSIGMLRRTLRTLRLHLSSTQTLSGSLQNLLQITWLVTNTFSNDISQHLPPSRCHGIQPQLAPGNP